MLTVVNSRKSRYDVLVGRPSKWGNPWVHGGVQTRKQVIDRYRVWIRTQENLMNSLKELEGKILGCFCVPYSCHGWVLVELVREMVLNRELGKTQWDLEKLEWTFPNTPPSKEEPVQ